MFDWWVSPYAYVLPAVWLLGCAAFPAFFSRLPWWVFAFAAFAVAGVNAYVNGWLVGLVSLASASVLLLLLVFTGLLSRLATFALPVTLAGLPPLAWIVAIAPGLAFAGLASVFLLRKAGGKGYVSMVMGETLSSTGILGVTSGSSMKDMKPDLSRLPLPLEGEQDVPESSSGDDSPIRAAGRKKIPFLLFLGLSVLAVGLVILLFG